MTRILHILSLLAAMLCMATAANAGSGVGFGTGAGGSSTATVRSSASASSQTDYRKIRGLSRAAEKSFSRGKRRDDRSVEVAGRPMNMRVVTVDGLTFAVFQEGGVKWDSRFEDLSGYLQPVARAQTGCRTTGGGWLQKYTNGGHPKYSVHIAC